MPVTIPIFYSDYGKARAAGTLPMEGTRCPRSPSKVCRHSGPLRLLNRTVTRPLVTFAIDEHNVAVVVDQQAMVALAMCPGCRGRFRVLPADAAPHKQFALPLIERLMEAYLVGDRSLRNVA